MRWLTLILLHFALSCAANAVLLEDCGSRLSARNFRDIFLSEMQRPWRLASFQATPLEVSAYLREWKSDLAEKLGIDSDRITGRFLRGSSAFEEISSPEETRVLLIRSRTGLRAAVLLKADAQANTLLYMDPRFPRAMRSSFNEFVDDGRKSIHLSAFEDELDRSGSAGNVLGVLTLKIPGVKFNP